MDQILSLSVAALAKTICKQQQENGFAVSAIDTTLRYAKHLSDFMESNTLQAYDERVGANFLSVHCSQFSSTTQGSFKLFISRMNAALHGEKFVTHVKMSEPEVLPVSLENLLIHLHLVR